MSIRVMLISSVQPEPASAGNIILYRHLINQTDVEIKVLGYKPPRSRWDNSSRNLMGRIGKTRFHRWAEDYNVWNNGYWLDSELPSKTNAKPDDLILTVAHGDACWAAQRYARTCRLPLVTIFHDWWPDIPSMHSFARRILEKQFRQLYRESNLAFCVSEGMREQLGSHPNAQILYPIPEKKSDDIGIKARGRGPQRKYFKVLYCGNLFEYGPMLREAMEILKGQPDVHIEVRGGKPNWPIAFCEESRASGQWLDFAPRKDLDEWLASADAFLVPMVFDSAMRRRMKTSFPSKLAEFAQFGKPIIVWGPEYSSAVQWAKSGYKAMCVTQNSPNVLAEAILQLAKDSFMQKYFSLKASESAKNEFNPHLIHNQFLTAINDCAKNVMKG